MGKGSGALIPSENSEGNDYILVTGESVWISVDDILSVYIYRGDNELNVSVSPEGMAEEDLKAISVSYAEAEAMFDDIQTMSTYDYDRTVSVAAIKRALSVAVDAGHLSESTGQNLFSSMIGEDNDDE